MAMGKREPEDQGSFWIPTSALPVIGIASFLRAGQPDSGRPGLRPVR